MSGAGIPGPPSPARPSSPTWRSTPAGALLLAVLAVGIAHAAEPPGVRSVRDYGAEPDGTSLCTAAIQRAIDDCAAGGGGTVLFPAGRYLSGTVFMRSGVSLRLEEQATLLGSTRPEDYPATLPASVRSFNDGRTQMNLIFGEGLADIAITGKGTIDGQGGAWPRLPRGAGNRPFAVRLVACKRVRVEGVTLRDSGFWMQHYLECDDLTVRGIRVVNHANWNNDAIDIDGCHRVLIEGLTSDSSDDGITLKSTTLRACEDVTIAGCVVRSHGVGIKFGSESIGGFRRIRIHDCEVARSEVRADAFGGRLDGKGGIALMSLDGAALEDVELSDIRIAGTLSPIFMRLHDRGRAAMPGGRKPIGCFRGVVLQRITALDAEPNGSLVSGIPGHPLEDITLRDIRIVVAGGVRQSALKPPADEEVHGSGAGPGMFGILPACGILFHHVRNLTLDRVAIETRAEDERPRLAFSDVDGVRLDGKDLVDQPLSPPGIRFLRQFVVPAVQGATP